MCDCKVHEHESACWPPMSDGYVCGFKGGDIDYCPMHGAAEQMREALIAVWTFPGVQDKFAPIESLGSIRAQVEAALKAAGY